MKLTEDKLIELLNAQISTIMDGEGFTKRFKETLQSMVKEMREQIVQPVSQAQGKMLLENLPFAKASGDFCYTESGSIINFKNSKAPWVKLSPEVEKWAVDFAQYLKHGTVSKLLSGGVDTDGGFTVPEDFRAIMIMYDMQETLCWNRATVWPMNGPKLSMPRLLQQPDVENASFDHFAGVTFEWTEEGGTKPETQPEFGLIELIVHELAGYTEVTNTLLDDSILNLVNYLTRIFRDAWYWITDKSFIDGTGGKRPMGIINDPQILTVQRQTAGTVQIEDIINMEARLPAILDTGAVWFITKKIRGALRGQKTMFGELILKESFSEFSDGYKMQLMGIPAVLADGKTPPMGSSGDVILGNWKWYYIGQRSDFAMDSSKHYKFRNNRTALRCSGRVDGQAAVPEAFVILDDPS